MPSLQAHHRNLDKMDNGLFRLEHLFLEAVCTPCPRFRGNRISHLFGSAKDQDDEAPNFACHLRMMAIEI